MTHLIRLGFNVAVFLTITIFWIFGIYLALVILKAALQAV